MKKLLLSLSIICFMKISPAQIVDLAWFQNLYHNSVQGFAFHGTHVWITKPDYVMMLDTVSGQTQVFNDFIFPDYDFFGSNTKFNSIVVDDSENVYVNYYGIENGIVKYDAQTWTNYLCSGFPFQYTAGSKLMMNAQNHLQMAHGKVVGEFDGTNWQTYTTTFANQYDYFTCGVRDSHDTLWLASYYGELISFYDGVFTLRLPSGMKYSIAIDDSDNLFIPLSSYHQILKFHFAIIDTLIIPNFNNVYQYLMTADSDSRVYVAGGDNNYYKYDGTNWIELSADIPGDYYESAIGVDPDHHIWLGSENGFLVKHESDFTSTAYIVNYSGLPDHGNYAVSAFIEYYYGNSWSGYIGTSEGIFGIKWNDQLVAKLDSGFDSMLTDKRINCIEKPSDFNFLIGDTVWFGTNEGLFGQDYNYNWLQFTTANSPLPNDTINYIFYDYDKLWIATNGGVACYHFNGTWQTYTTANSPLPSDHVHFIGFFYPDYVFCTTNGVAFYDDPTWKIMNTSNSGLNDNDVKEYYYNYDGHHYFGTVAHGICDSIYNGGWQYLNTSTGLPTDSINFFSYLDGNIIVGTNGGGLLSIDDNGNYLYNTTNIQGIDFSDVTDHSILFLGEAVEFWILTDQGLLYKDEGGNAPLLQSQSNEISTYVVNDNLFIQFTLRESNTVVFDLFDLEGRSLTHVKLFGSKGVNHLELPVSNLAFGIYLLRMRAGNQNFAVKVLKPN